MIDTNVIWRIVELWRIPPIRVHALDMLTHTLRQQPSWSIHCQIRCDTLVALVLQAILRPCPVSPSIRLTKGRVIRVQFEEPLGNGLIDVPALGVHELVDSTDVVVHAIYTKTFVGVGTENERYLCKLAFTQRLLTKPRDQAAIDDVKPLEPSVAVWRNGLVRHVAQALERICSACTAD